MSVPHPFASAPYVIGNVIVSTEINFVTPGTAEVVAYSFMMPGRTLKTLGDRLMIRLHWQSAGNTNTKNLRVRVGGLSGLQVALYTTTVANALSDNSLALVRGVTQSSLIAHKYKSYSSTAAQGASYVVHSLDLDQNYEIAVTLETPTAAGDATFKYIFVDAVIKSP